MLPTIVPPKNSVARAVGRLGLLTILVALGLPALARPAAAGPAGAERLRPFVETYCLGCHDAATKKAGLDLETLTSDFANPVAFDAWVKVHDKLKAGAMPPPRKTQPPPAEAAAIVRTLAERLTEVDQQRKRDQGRSLFRRLNRREYENTLRDLLGMAGLEVSDLLPEDGRAHGYDKSGAALELSHVQLARYMEAADVALDQAIATQIERPEVVRVRIYPGAQYDFKNVLTNGDAVFLKDGQYDHGTGVAIVREKEAGSVRKYEQAGVFPYEGAVGVFRHEDDAFRPRFNTFIPTYPGRYRLRLSLWAFQWDKGDVKPALRTAAASLTQEARLLGNFDAPSLEPAVHEIEVWLTAGTPIHFNAASLWHLRVSEMKGRAAEYVGPGIAVDWLEVEGPLLETWPEPGHRRLFADLALEPLPKSLRRDRGKERDPSFPKRRPARPRGGPQNRPANAQLAMVCSTDPAADAERLIGPFLRRAFRRPVAPEETARYVALARQRLEAKDCFQDALRTAYKAALCSPEFLFLLEKPGPLDDWALASRLSYFLWSSLPDEALLARAEEGKLHDPQVLRAEVERMLADPRAERFADDFVDQWLDLREIDATSPDRRLYPEFSPYLRASMLGESYAFFRELLRSDLAVANVVDSNFALLNQKMAEHYGIPSVTGSGFRRVALPAGQSAHRGGFLTQASVLKVTANGTVTSPVKRGAWVQRKIVGQPPNPPPPNIPAIEPDVRGATTVRELLVKHRTSASCAACHAQIDPPGFALESFDVIGGWQDRYRSLGDGAAADPAKTEGHKVGYRLALPVDAAGESAAGRPFKDIDEFRGILLEDQRQLARNLVTQLLIYATGATAGFSDRADVEQALDATADRSYGIRSLIHALVQSSAFQCK